MAFLQEALDDPTAAPCGRCDVCAGAWYSADVPEAAAEAASAALDRPGVELAPRAQWPTGADRLGVDVKGKIAPSDQIETGRAVARLTDLGWGQRLRTLLGDDGVGGVVDARPRGARHRGGPGRRVRRPGAAVGLRRAPGRRAAQGLRPRARRPGTGRSGPGAVVAMPVAAPAAAGDRARAGAGPPGTAAVPGGDVAAARRPDRAAGRQQRLPAGRRLGPDRRRAPSCATGWPRPARPRSCSSTTWPTPGGR